MTYDTLNPLGSTSPKDLFDNAHNTDYYANGLEPFYPDRFGVQRLSLAGMRYNFNAAQEGRAAQFAAAQAERAAQFQQFLTDSAYVPMGNYTSGLQFDRYTQYVAYDGNFYTPAPGSLPFTTSGTWEGADEDLFVLFNQDNALRQELADPERGARIVASGSVTLEDIPSLLSFSGGASQNVSVRGYHPNSNIGGGRPRYWDANRSKSEHNGGTVIDPQKVFPADWSVLADVQAWYAPAASGAGCWVMLDDGSALLPEEFGAKSDGLADDLLSLRGMLSVAEGKAVEITRHSRLSVDDEWEGGLFVPNNCNISFKGDGQLSLLPHFSRRYGILKLYDVGNITINDPLLDGRRDLNTHTLGEWGHGIDLCGTTGSVVINRPKTLNTWGDGIALSASKTDPVARPGAIGVTINNPLCGNGRRQGISIISARNLVINDPVAINTNGVLPGAGIDIEPNTNSDVLEGIEINRPVTSNNQGAGILVFLQNIVGANPKNIQIRVTDHRDDGSQRGLFFQGLVVGPTAGAITGSIEFDKTEYLNSKLGGIVASSWQHTALSVTIESPIIKDWNRSNYAAADYGSAITIINDTGSVIAADKPIGNITIKNRKIIATDSMGKGIDFVVNRASGLVADVNLLEFAAVVPLMTSQYSNSGITVTDDKKNYRQVLNSNTSITQNSIPTILNNVGTGVKPVYTLPALDAAFNKRFTLINFRETSPGSLVVRPPVGGNFLGMPLNQGLECPSVSGCEITVERWRGNVWRIIEQIGVWSPSA
jgi:hypothetical protein